MTFCPTYLKLRTDTPAGRRHRGRAWWEIWTLIQETNPTTVWSGHLHFDALEPFPPDESELAMQKIDSLRIGFSVRKDGGCGFHLSMDIIDIR